MNDVGVTLPVGDLSGDWRVYPGDRLIMRHPAGFAVVIPQGAVMPLPLACAVCSTMLRTRDDEASASEFGCCYLCALHWAHPRRELWKDGWRPPPDQVERVVSERPPLFVSLG